MIRTLIFFVSFLCYISDELCAQDDSSFSEENIVQDIHHLFKKINDAHFNPYLFITKENLEAKRDRLIQEFRQRDNISQYEFVIRTMQLLANINDGHTSLQWWSTLPKELNERPAFFGQHIMINDSAEIYDSDGKQLLSINGRSASQLVKEALSCYGGNDQFKKRFVEKTFFAAYLYLSNIKAPFKVAYNNGTIQSINATLNLKELIGRYTDLQNDYKFEIIEDSIGIIYYNSCHDLNAFQVFLDNVFQQLKEKKIDKLIIDIRNNTGGDSSLNDLLLSYLTQRKYRQSSTRYWKISKTLHAIFSADKYRQLFGKKTIKMFLAQKPGSILKEDEYVIKKPKRNKYFFQGKSCLLIGPGTFSSANFLADAISTYDIMPIIGTPTGENTNDFGEQIEIVLPATKLVVTLSVAFDIGADGQAEKLDVVHPDYLVQKEVVDFAVNFLNNTTK